MEQFDHIPILESNYKEMTKHYQELLDRIERTIEDIFQVENNQNNSKNFEKQIIKLSDDLKKQEERFIKRIDDSFKKITDYSQKTIKNIEKETQRAQKDLQKILQASIVNEYMVKEHGNKEEFIIPDPKTVCSIITESLESSTNNDPFKFPKYNELVAVLASIIIFNQLPKNVFNDMVNQTIIQGNKASPRKFSCRRFS